MPLHTAKLRRADSSEKVKCTQNASLTDLYFIKPVVSAFFLFCQQVNPVKNLKIFLMKPELGLISLGLDRIGQSANAFNLDFNKITIFHPKRRLTPMADT